MPAQWFASNWKDLVQASKTSHLSCPQVQWGTALAQVRDMLLSLSLWSAKGYDVGIVGFHLNRAPNACFSASLLLLSSLSEYRKH